jgi:uncharacterized protein
MTLVPGAVMVIAKTPVAGRVKTRLCPPLTVDQACEVAWAALLDTLDAAARVPSQRHVLVLDGERGDWIPAGFEVIDQHGDGLAARLANAFTDVADSAIVIAMDTPQVTAAQLTEALSALVDHDSVFGPAADGGYWLIGLHIGVDPRPIFADIPMSVDHTGTAQMERLASLGCSVRVVDRLRDIDTIEDLVAVANEAPTTRTAAALTTRSISRGAAH